MTFKNKIIEKNTFSGRNDAQTSSARAAGPRGGVLATDWQPLDPETDAAPPPFPFTHEVGTALTLQLASQQIDFFRHLFDDRIIQLIVDETNQ